ncbi:MAG: hypothetical protein N4A41_09305 [Crocinitomicaceae bacterium]|nr:hypothetical protein [Crocinitomicaceae bacterium]
MKLTRIVMVLLASSTLGMAYGQVNTPKKQAPQAAEKPQAEKKADPKERAEKLTARMDKELQLTETQRAKVAELNYGIALKNEAIRNDATLTQEQKKERIKMNNDQRKIQLQNMLTAEQNAKMEALEKERMERRQEKGKKPMKGAPSQEAEELEGL